MNDAQSVGRRAVFLDRDGVLNRAIIRHGKPYPPADLTELEVLPGVSESLALLKAAGYMLIVVTNQPDVARGTTSKSLVEAINNDLAQRLPIDEFRTCYHDSKDGCSCRKPSPGSMISAAQQHRLDLSLSYMVGDRWRDIEAGQRAGCKTIFIDYGYDEKKPIGADYLTTSLLDATTFILGENR